MSAVFYPPFCLKEFILCWFSCLVLLFVSLHFCKGMLYLWNNKALNIYLRSKLCQIMLYHFGRKYDQNDIVQLVCHPQKNLHDLQKKKKKLLKEGHGKLILFKVVLFILSDVIWLQTPPDKSKRVMQATFRLQHKNRTSLFWNQSISSQPLHKTQTKNILVLHPICVQLHNMQKHQLL